MALILAGGDGGNSTITGSTSNVTITNAQSLQLPSGNSDQRPSSPANGAIRYNTTTSSVEGYTAGAWGSIGGAGGGGITWQNVITSNTTVSVGNAYPINTTSAPVWITLPSSPGAGNSIILTDYARTWSANNVTLNPNGKNIQSSNANVVLNTNGLSINLVYIDTTQGWLVYASGNAVGPYAVDYLIVAGGGGGGGGNYHGGAGGGGGMVTGAAVNVVPGTSYTVTVGGGGAGGASTNGAQGSNSSITGQTTAIGGGYGGNYQAITTGGNGGSGGGGSGATPGGSAAAGGAGTAGQGNSGGNGTPNSPNAYGAGGGGGAGQAGNPGSSSAGGNGGNGSTWSNGTTYAGGGGGSTYSGAGTYPAGSGGSGGGGPGGAGNSGTAGSPNTGGGGGGGERNGPAGGSGGSGVVIIRYTGSAQKGSGGTVSITGGYVYHTFTSSGTYIA